MLPPIIYAAMPCLFRATVKMPCRAAPLRYSALRACAIRCHAAFLLLALLRASVCLPMPRHADADDARLHDFISMPRRHAAAADVAAFRRRCATLSPRYAAARCRAVAAAAYFLRMRCHADAAPLPLFTPCHDTALPLLYAATRQY